MPSQTLKAVSDPLCPHDVSFILPTWMKSKILRLIHQNFSPKFKPTMRLTALVALLFPHGLILPASLQARGESVSILGGDCNCSGYTFAAEVPWDSSRP